MNQLGQASTKVNNLKKALEGQLEDTKKQLHEAQEAMRLMQSWGERDAADKCRQYCQVLVLHYRAWLEQAKLEHAEIAGQVKNATQSSSKQHTATLKEARDHLTVLSELCEEHRAIARESLDRVQNKAPAGRSRAIRSTVVRAVVVHAEKDSVLLDWNDVAQAQFDTMISDQRTKEGQMLHRFCTTVASTGQITPISVLAFVKSFSAFVRGSIGLSFDDAPKLEVFVQRTTFARVFPYLMIGSPLALSHANDLFRAQIQWLQNCKVQEFGVIPILSQGALSHLSTASDWLFTMELCVCPADMLLCLWEASHAVFECVKALHRTAGIPHQPTPQLAVPHPQPPVLSQNAIGADQFFPLFLWACIRADLRSINNTVVLLKTCLSDTDRITELGYYLTCLEGASTFVMQVEPDQLHPCFGSNDN